MNVICFDIYFVVVLLNDEVMYMFVEWFYDSFVVF